MRSLKSYLVEARRDRWALGQFNFSTAEELKGIMQAALEYKSPVILGLSRNGSLVTGLDEAVKLVDFYRKKYKHPVFLNYDHCIKKESLMAAVDLGFDMVHFDGSSLFFKDNIKQTYEASLYTHKKEALIEGEVGVIPGEHEYSPDEKMSGNSFEITKMEDAMFFLKNTEIDLFSGYFGSVHGVYKEMPGINVKEIGDLSKETKKYLVLHGGSGLNKTVIKQAIKNGIVKINFSTEIKNAFTSSLRNSLDDETITSPYKYLPASIKKVQEVVAGKIKILGSLNKS